MSENRRDVWRQLAIYKDYINGTTKYPKNLLEDCSRFFWELHWRVSIPYSKGDSTIATLTKISKFFNSHEGFETKADNFIDLYVLYKVDGHNEIT